jgi:predicted ABC-type ATPase
MTPKMIVIAGAPGSGKSTLFPPRTFGVDSFNVDDRCRELHGSYQGIPLAIRRSASSECEVFVLDHIKRRVSFAVETTFRTKIALEQATLARTNGFKSFLFFSCTEDPAIHIRRVTARAVGGGHAAPEEEIRTTYAASLSNLRDAIHVFDFVECYDTTIHNAPARHVARIHRSKVLFKLEPIPNWLRPALESL